jgi:DMSO/TMAO reductase YedYZ molybdopterin-dependent catalytic subunit
VSLPLAGCLPRATVTLDGAELDEYQGERLDSVTSLPDNSIRGPQRIAREDVRLDVTGLVEHPLSFTLDEVLARQQYSKVITLNCVEGWSATLLWEGVLLDDLFQLAGVKSGAVNVIFHALDTYTSSLTLDFVRQNKILLAHQLNGVPLPAERGFPFQVVAEDKWGYKWAKWVKKIELSDNAGYRGFWESSGYSPKGDLKESPRGNQ